MKLVEILARELKEWPEDIDNMCQSEVDLKIYHTPKNMTLRYFTVTRAASDRGIYNRVTRDMWEAERKRLAEPKPDWSKAPEGATHYNSDRPYVWLKSGTPVSFFNTDLSKWMDYSNNGQGEKDIERAFPSPAPMERRRLATSGYCM